MNSLNPNDVSYWPTVSVIVPIYNGEEDLPDLLDCLTQQTYPKEKTEYFLVDNNSSDRTSDILAIAVEKANHEGLKFYHLTENQIQSSYAARNAGIKASKGEILVFTDMDCRPYPNWVEEIVKPFTNPSIGIVAGELIALPGNSLLEKYAERAEIMAQKFLLEHPFCPYGQTANLAILRDIFKKVGIFRPYLTTGGDADICWRIQRETHYKIEYTPKAIIQHRHRSHLKSFQSQLRRYGCSNRYLHELYGVKLMQECTTQDIVLGVSRWIVQDIPKKSIKLLLGRADWIDLIRTPIDLIGFQARSIGQKEAKLPQKAKQIEWL
ncbi:glycosyltransferase [Aphanothece hegewaldii CCALA 016]|uniref:Glycosyltransferase n=2 Tax=Aphanothece TaxID=1121 RepID=A0A2T1M1Q8_9CHRO|nr:glycosyltransferase [Aphanothece hegewaldii CCALA 016]